MNDPYEMLRERACVRLDLLTGRTTPRPPSGADLSVLADAADAVPDEAFPVGDLSLDHARQLATFLRNVS